MGGSESVGVLFKLQVGGGERASFVGPVVVSSLGFVPLQIFSKDIEEWRP